MVVRKRTAAAATTADKREESSAGVKSSKRNKPPAGSNKLRQSITPDNINNNNDNNEDGEIDATSHSVGSNVTIATTTTATADLLQDEETRSSGNIDPTFSAGAADAVANDTDLTTLRTAASPITETIGDAKDSSHLVIEDTQLPDKSEIIKNLESKLKILEDQLVTANQVKERQASLFDQEQKEIIELNKSLRFEIENKEEELKKLKLLTIENNRKVEHMTELSTNLENSLEKSNSRLLEMTESNRTLKDKVSDIILESKNKDTEFQGLIHKYEDDMTKLRAETEEMEIKYQKLFDETKSEILICTESKLKAEQEVLNITDKYEKLIKDTDLLSMKSKTYDSNKIECDSDPVNDSDSSSSPTARHITGSLVLNCQSVSELVREKLQALQNCEILQSKLDQVNQKLNETKREYDKKIPHFNDLKTKYDLSLKQIVDTNKKFTELLFKYDKANSKILILESNASKPEATDIACKSSNSIDCNDTSSHTLHDLSKNKNNLSTDVDVTAPSMSQDLDKNLIQSMKVQLDKYKQLLKQNNLIKEQAMIDSNTVNFDGNVMTESSETAQLLLMNLNEKMSAFEESLKNHSQLISDNEKIRAKCESISVISSLKDQDLLRREKESSILRDYVAQLLNLLSEMQQRTSELEKQVNHHKIIFDDANLKCKHLEIKINILEFIKNAAEAKNKEFCDKLYENFAVSKLVNKLNEAIVTLSSERNVAAKKINDADTLLSAQTNLLENSKQYYKEHSDELQLKLEQTHEIVKNLKSSEEKLNENLLHKNLQIDSLIKAKEAEISKINENHQEIVQNFERKLTEMAIENDELQLNEDLNIQLADNRMNLLIKANGEISKLKGFLPSAHTLKAIETKQLRLKEEFGHFKGIITKSGNSGLTKHSDAIEKIIDEFSRLLESIHKESSACADHIDSLFDEIDIECLRLEQDQSNSGTDRIVSNFKDNKSTGTFNETVDVNKHLVHLLRTCIHDGKSIVADSDNYENQLHSFINHINSKLLSIGDLEDQLSALKNTASLNEEMHSQLIQNLSNLEEENNKLTSAIEAQKLEKVPDRTLHKTNLEAMQLRNNIHTSLAKEINNVIQTLNTIERSLAQMQRFGKLSDALSSRLKEINTRLKDSATKLSTSHQIVLDQISSTGDNDIYQGNALNPETSHGLNYTNEMQQAKSLKPNDTSDFDEQLNPDHHDASTDRKFGFDEKNQEIVDAISAKTKDEDDVLNVSNTSSASQENSPCPMDGHELQDAGIDTEEEFESGELSSTPSPKPRSPKIRASGNKQSQQFNESLLFDFEDNHNNNNNSGAGAGGKTSDLGNSLPATESSQAHINLMKIPDYCDEAEAPLSANQKNNIVWTRSARSNQSQDNR